MCSSDLGPGHVLDLSAARDRLCSAHQHRHRTVDSPGEEVGDAHEDDEQNHRPLNHEDGLLRHGLCHFFFVKFGYQRPWSVADFDRPLASRGRRATARLARAMQETGLRFDLVLCSSAERARETWGRIAEAMGSRAPTDYEDGLYLGDAEALMARLRGLDPTVDSVLVVGHNPALETLARRLCRRGTDDALARPNAKYPTGGLAEIALDCKDWPEIPDACGTLTRFTVPRDLP